MTAGRKGGTPSGGRVSGPRQLTDDERGIWREVTRSVRPLRALPPPAAPLAPTQAAAAAPPLSGSALAVAAAVPPRSGPAPRQAPVPPAAALSRRDLRKIARGAEPIGLRLDLHGMTRAEARAALERTLARARREGVRTVLVITGKGLRAGAYAEREPGVLRREVPLWLGLPGLRELVVGFDTAGPGHGGEGALYIRLRRA